MDTTHWNSFLTNIRSLIATDNLNEALPLLQKLLVGSPKLNDIILQSARWHDITHQIHQGIVAFEEANVSKNKIRMALLELLQEIDDLQQTQAPIKAEVEKYTSEGKTFIQHAEKIYNIEKIDNANFS